MHFEANVNPIYPEGLKDNTHFNEYGARRIAELVYTELIRQNIPLSKRFVKQVKKANLNKEYK
jgi:lysophospholipase L1-like esterase